MKDAVNFAIDYINTQQFEWPFNHSSHNETLVAGQTRYTLPSDAKKVDFDSFRVQRNDTFGNRTQWLQQISYDEYIAKLSDYEYNSNTNIRDVPRYVFRTPDNNYGVAVPPKEAYTLTFDYYIYNSDLENATDVPTIPESFRRVIVDGAMYYTHNFREDEDAAQLSWKRFEDGIEDMRILLISRYEYVYDTRVYRRDPTVNERLG